MTCLAGLSRASGSGSGAVDRTVEVIVAAHNDASFCVDDLDHEAGCRRYAHTSATQSRPCTESLDQQGASLEVDPGMRPTYLIESGFCDVVVAGVDERGVSSIRRIAVFDNLLGLGAHDVGGAWMATLFTSPDPERYVYRMWTNRGDRHRVFVHVWGKREVMSLDLRSRAMIPVAGPSDTGSALVVPDLADDYNFVWPRPHAVEGNLYFFFGMEHKQLVLQDSDRDGDLDGYFVLHGPEDLKARGLADASQYED